MAVGDFNNDGIDDLAVGAPGDQIGRQDNAGSVTVFSGSSRGLRQRGQLIRQRDADISDTSEAGDLFGWSLAAGNLDGQAGDDLVIGAPGEDWGSGRFSAVDVGVVHALTSLPTDPSAGSSGLTGSPYGLNGADLVDHGAAIGDSLGFSLAIGNFNNDGAMDLAVGSPGADVVHNGNLLEGAGRVDVFYGNVAFNVVLGYGQQVTQPSMYNPGFLERFGWSLAAGNVDGEFGDDLAIGVPGENIVNPGLAIEAADAVNIAWSTAGGSGVTAISPSNMAFLHQTVQGLDSNAVALTDLAERGDRFGYSLAVGHFDNDDRADLMVGVPFEDLVIDGTTYEDAGQVHVFMDDVLTGNCPAPSSRRTREMSQSVRHRQVINLVWLSLRPTSTTTERTTIWLARQVKIN